jgi:hypothetical protein
MMSGEDSQVPIWSYRVNLDKRVRSDHPLRRIRAALVQRFRDVDTRFIAMLFSVNIEILVHAADYRTGSKHSHLVDPDIAFSQSFALGFVPGTKR